MRQIKFRAWDKAKKIMRKVDAIEYGDIEYGDIEFDEDCVIFSTLKRTLSTPDYPSEEYWEREYKHFDEVELMQFTGLCDKNGKEIFEGDIVKYIDQMPVYPEARFEEVAFHYEDGFIPVIRPFINLTSYNYNTKSGDYFAINAKECEIIGNIYEHKSLLKNK